MLHAQSNPVARAEKREKAPSINPLVPQVILGLIHTPQVQEDLKLSESQVEALEEFLPTIDGDWFRSRNLEFEKQSAEVAGLEDTFWEWASEHWESEQVKRCRELELQGQGIRCLLRTDVTKVLELQDEQLKSITEFAKQTAIAQLELQQASLKGENIVSSEQKAKAATKEEKSNIAKTLTNEQRARMSKLMGKKFDTAALERVYPMAPELIPVQHWINSEPLQIEGLKGKVVIVHFYAFQCHNCHANFPHYNRWAGQYDPSQVVVLGIQTPETSAESDPEQVKQAAYSSKFTYPVLIDLESANWKAWSNTMWPTVYVIDKKGYLRLWWQGELNWNGATGDKKIEELVERLIQD